MTHPLQAAIRTQLLAVAEERDLPIATADAAALTEAALGAALAIPLPDAPVQLTNQQLGVLIGLARGDFAQETARRMCLTPSTVKTHLRHLYRRLGVRTGAQAVAVAMSYGFLHPALHAGSFPVPGQRDRRAS
ncbi:helix-turn-helix transcriptional regulator [Streptomyces sp. NPDC048565]|uniref:response regulator transcription factor n=1 Tax=Streptomyces sp. NPDC048565 TaxID=3155266 RepID=UPI003427602C